MATALRGVLVAGAALAALCASLVLQVAAQHFNSIAGPYRIVTDRVEHCPTELEARVPFVYTWRAARDRRNPQLWRVWANVTFPTVFDNNYGVDLNWASWSSRGGWKDNAYVMRAHDFCKFAPTYMPDPWRRLVVGAFNDPTRTCPFPPGFYEIKNLTTDFSIKFMPVFYYGTWRVTLRVKDDNRGAGLCSVLFIKIIPKHTRA